jgi:hypothetical protein
MTYSDHPSDDNPRDQKFPDRRAPPTRLRDHGVEGIQAPSAAQRLLIAQRVRDTLDHGLSPRGSRLIEPNHSNPPKSAA